MPLHEFLHQRRKAVCGWSQSELARRAGVAPSTISRLEKGTTDDPPMGLLARVAPWYKVPVLELWERGGYLRAQDAQAIGELLAQLSPAEMVRLAQLSPADMVRLGLTAGNWDDYRVKSVITLLALE